MQAIVIIPARYGATRLPGKPLLPLGGKPVIQHVYERCRAARLAERVLVATDDERILDVVNGFGGEAVMTSAACRTGTDRVAEAASSLEADIVVNVQGDEPLIEPLAVDRLIELMASDPQAAMGTLVRRADNAEEVLDPNIVKVVCGERGRALYFSRSPIPFVRGAHFTDETVLHYPYLVHIGIYAFRIGFLAIYATLATTALEACEQLEQLRVLGHGYEIAVAQTDYRSVGIDTERDLLRAETMLSGSAERPSTLKQGDVLA